MIRTKLSITNDETGEWEVLFYENEKICENLEVNIESSKIARQYSAYSLILDDINLLLKWAKELNNKISVFEKKQSNGSS